MIPRNSAITQTTQARQQELPLAIVDGNPLMELPQDLYIPPQALEIFLETFEGPLDLLLYLIKKQNIDILDIPIAKITHQYMRYVEQMRAMQFELAAEYLVMAAMLAEIKSRLLLPQSHLNTDEEEDPRAELVRRLQEYEQFRKAAEDLDQLPRLEREHFLPRIDSSHTQQKTYAPVPLNDLLAAMQSLLTRAEQFSHHHIERERLSVRERMSHILDLLQQRQKQQTGAGQTEQKVFIEFPRLFSLREGKSGVVVSFMAILELNRQSLIEIAQNHSMDMIHICLGSRDN